MILGLVSREDIRTILISVINWLGSEQWRS
jgi:hypothetical protein